MKNRIVLIATLLMSSAGAVAAQNDIRTVDFANFTYQPYCAAEESENVTVTDREYSKETQQDGYIDRFYFRVDEPVFGDLTGDGQDEAVIISVCNTGGTGNFSEGFVFGRVDGKIEMLGRIPGGDRAYGGLRQAIIERGILIVESNDPGELGGACCPEMILTTKYRLGLNGLTRIGSPVRREIFPSERVRFARGSTRKTLSVTIAADEGRRFVVGGRSGQRLRAEVDSQLAGLRLLEDVEPKYTDGKISAILPKTGDYTVEVRNDSPQTRTFAVTIFIDQP